MRDVEEEVLGTNHAIIGGRLAEVWRLPVEIREAVRCHHRPRLSKGTPVLAAAVCLANSLCHIKDLGFEGKKIVPDDDAIAMINDAGIEMNEERIDTLLADMDGAMEGLEEFIELLHE